MEGLSFILVSGFAGRFGPGMVIRVPGGALEEGNEMAETTEDFEMTEDQQAPELDKTLEEVLIAALNEAKRVFLENNGELVPFTALASEGMLEIAPHGVGEVDDCFAAAERYVAASEGKDAYAFCYDGFVDTDDGQCDILIAEGGLPGEQEGHAIGLIYSLPEEEGGEIEIDDEAVYVGPAPNFLA